MSSLLNDLSNRMSSVNKERSVSRNSAMNESSVSMSAERASSNEFSFAGGLQRVSQAAGNLITTGQFSAVGTSRASTPTSMVSWFGVPLTEQEMVADGSLRVPAILTAVKRRIDELESLQSEGMFRLSADKRVQQLVRGRLESGEDPDSVLDGCDDALCSGILKEYLRSLPSGTTWPAGRAASEFSAAMLASPDHSMTKLLKRNLSRASLDLFLWVLRLMASASALSAQSRMDDQALAVVFAPLLIRGDDDDPPQEQLKLAQDGILILRKLLRNPTAGAPAVAAPANAAPLSSSEDLGAIGEETSIDMKSLVDARDPKKLWRTLRTVQSSSSYLSRLKLLEQRISHLDQTMQALCTEGSELRRALEEADRLPKPVGKVGRAFSRDL